MSRNSSVTAAIREGNFYKSRDPQIRVSGALLASEDVCTAVSTSRANGVPRFQREARNSNCSASNAEQSEATADKENRRRDERGKEKDREDKIENGNEKEIETGEEVAGSGRSDDSDDCGIVSY
ncbi:UNVERIFIED_CONTAM: hypothetical protein HHA_449820 [Hammondia hammondi]|eukprot:XP_008882513.1 hypothetical protein HHA_449820 [Hammondia hammondi]